jgi:hypothetical protein
MSRNQEPFPPDPVPDASNQGTAETLSPEGLAEERHWQETLVAIASVKAGRIVPEEIVHEWLGSWGQPNESAPPVYQERRKRLERYATWSDEEAAEFDKILAFQRQIDPKAIC